MSTPSIAASIAALEKQILEAKTQLARLRRQVPPEPFADAIFKTWEGGEVRLSQLFGDREDLILVHNMGHACAYCTLWADGLNGILHHLEDRAAFVVVSGDSPAVQQPFATGRGWRFRMVSAEGSTFTVDAGFADGDGPLPGVSTFRRSPDGTVARVGHAEFGPGDDFCSLWHLFDLLAGGPQGWEPKFDYGR